LQKTNDQSINERKLRRNVLFTACVKWITLYAHVSILFCLGNLHFAFVTMDDMKSSSVRYACYLKNSVLDIRYPGSYTQLKVTRGLQHKLTFLVLFVGESCTGICTERL